MFPERLPWEVVETFPSTDPTLIAEWELHVVESLDGSAERVRALIGRALVNYWAVQEGVTTDSIEQVAARRRADVDEAIALARSIDDDELLSEALLGWLMATWAPDQPRVPALEELIDLRATVNDEEIRLRILEWSVLDRLDHADMLGVDTAITRFAEESRHTNLQLFRRREVLWRGCVAMLEGRLDEALDINQRAISSSADTAGSPFSFQNVAITVAIERYLRRGLHDLIDAIRSIRASSPRVAVNWDAGLAFALSETGTLEEAAEIVNRLGQQQFCAVPRDLNWLVTMHLLALTALNLDDRDHGVVLLDALRPFAHLDATHGSGYASYGPVARPVASLEARWGNPVEAERWFGFVLETRADGPWTALARLDRATARRETLPQESLIDATEAAARLDAFGMAQWAVIARQLAEGLLLRGVGGAVARLREGRWELRHSTGAATIDATVGARHLLTLLAHPGEIFEAARLDPSDDASLPTSSRLESTLDRAALTAYRRRADTLSASQRTAADDKELAFLRRELSASRYQTSTSAELERARVRVTKAICRAIDDIASQSSGLGEHLRSTISTGGRCSYTPADGRGWHVMTKPLRN